MTEDIRKQREIWEDDRPLNPLDTDLYKKLEIKDYECPACGVVFEVGKAYGFCCMRSNCPTRTISTC